MKKQLEQKQISQFAMIHMNEARTLLYKMLQEGIVQLQEVPKSVDHNPIRTFYLWNVDLPTVYEVLTENMYKGVRNLRMRLVKEEKDALEKVGGTIPTTLNAQQQEMLAKLEKIEDRLECSIVHLMTLLMFFEDF